jgi:RND family efflux transporter MFP subunit
MPPPDLIEPGARRLAFLALAVLLAACGGEAPPAPTATASIAVTTTETRSQPLDRALVVSGSVAAWQEMSLGVELAGTRVAAVLVEVGDPVAAGQPLLKLDARTLDVQARQAEAALAQARANLALARSESARGDQLLAQNLISTADADQLAANLIRAEAQLTTAEADRDAARLRLSFATLVAPQPGVISARSVQPGQVVAAGEELLRLIRDGRLEWRADLAERDFTRVATGTVIELTGPEGETVRGRVRAVSPALDPATRTGLVYADLPEPGSLRAGMFAQGRIVLGRAQATVLPREAVVFRDGLPYVFVVQPGEGAEPVARVAQRRITVGIQQGEISEVTGGLAAGERVAVRGAGFLSDGDLVRIAPAASQAAAPPGGANP